MKKNLFLAALVAMFAISCQKDFNEPQVSAQNEDQVTQDFIRSYDEAMAIAESSLLLLENKEVTRATKKRIIARNSAQVIRGSLTRNGNGSDEPLAYVFNFENEEGFAVIAANENINPIIAVTEKGSYTYGEPTGVEAFDDYMNNTISTLAVLPPSITLPDDPITPTPGFYADTIDVYNRVEPLLATRWGQHAMYGKYCPNHVAGCAATAFAQIMACHKHPLRVTYTHMLQPPTVLIQWGLLLRHIEGYGVLSTCDCGCDSNTIGLIIREIGERFDMRYEPAANGEDAYSSTSAENIAEGIPTLGYSTPIYTGNIAGSFNSYKNKIFRNLDAENPVIICGVDLDEKGHAWVIDGYHEEAHGINYYVSNPNYNPMFPIGGEPEYIFSHSTVVRTELLHYNWGASGMFDGWFNVGCFDMGAAYSYDGLYTNESINYNVKVAIIYDIVPN